MYDYIIATSSTSDLPRTYLEAHNIPFIPYTYTIGNDLYEDDCREETRQKVYEGMRNGDRLKTSMINEYIYDEFFESLLAQGKDVIFLDMSQKMSVSYEKSKIGAKMALEKYPERKLYVMDTLCISGGLGTLVDNMVTLAEGGAGYDEVIAWGEANKLKIAHRFTVDDLNYLKAGGRIGGVTSVVGSLLKIRPIISCDADGTYHTAALIRGDKNAKKKLLELAGQFAGDEPCWLALLNGAAPDEAAAIKPTLKKQIRRGKIVAEHQITASLAVHTGPGLLGIGVLKNP